MSTSVTKIPGKPNDPEANLHHVIKNGRITGFKNPYPSYTPPEVFRHAFWYVPLPHYSTPFFLVSSRIEHR